MPTDNTLTSLFKICIMCEDLEISHCPITPSEPCHMMVMIVQGTTTSTLFASEKKRQNFEGQFLSLPLYS